MNPVLILALIAPTAAASGQWVLEQEDFTCSIETLLAPNQTMPVAIAEGQDSATLHGGMSNFRDC